MTLTAENHFFCDLKKPDGSRDCEVDFYYEGPKQNPLGGPPVMPVWSPGIQAAINKRVAVTHPQTGFTTFYCCDEHAMEGINRGQHLPPLPPKVLGATEADLKRAQSGMKVVDGMRTAKPS